MFQGMLLGKISNETHFNNLVDSYIGTRGEINHGAYGVNERDEAEEEGEEEGKEEGSNEGNAALSLILMKKRKRRERYI